MRALNASETKVLSMAIKGEPGMTMCSTWNVTDHKGETISVGFVARANPETEDDGSERLICRAMNWRAEHEGPPTPPDHLAQRILDGLARPGVHRALVDPVNWRLLKWLDEPAPFFDWRARETGDPGRQPRRRGSHGENDTRIRLTELPGVLRLRANDGGWMPVHMTINRVELGQGHVRGSGGLALPTDEEMAAAGIEDAEAQ